MYSPYAYAERIASDIAPDKVWFDIDPYTDIDQQDTLQRTASEGSAVTRALLSQCVRAWSFQDANGNPLPISEETVGLIKGPDLKKITDRIREANAPKSTEEQRAFLAESSPGSTDTPSQTLPIPFPGSEPPSSGIDTPA